MADDFPFAVFAGDDPGDLDRQGPFIECERNRARDVDQIGADGCRDEIGELSAGRLPSRQSVEVGRNAVSSPV